MTKKNKKQDKDLEQLKNNLEKEVENKDYEEKIKQLENENKKLQAKLKDSEEILKNTQLQYISLKNEFDSYQRRTKLQLDEIKQEINEKNILWILPIIELFELSYKHIPEEFKDNKWTEWLNIIKNKIDEFLKNNNIELIETIWQELNEEYHEAIWMKDVEDKKLKNKIVEEVKKWYLIKYPDKKKVLQAAKVLLWK